MSDAPGRSGDKQVPLHEMADLIVAVGRRLPPPTDPEFEPCTPLEISVMRFVHRHPGTSAGAASEAVRLPSSNFSRVLRGLEKRDLVERVVNERNARGVLLYPTEKARRNLRLLHEHWDRTLHGIIDDPGTVQVVSEALRRIEDALTAGKP
ncbi:MarR family winged helix-turn-helix transcriptional regulator [Streptomyces sp. SID11385]|uniref:MarR family winged helix-turn-helix transcriptional regulator n=1 Tax=Streptomyces sp. SID11385 TaxID=2706031 RepID=UPI0013CC269F|nr:MarR family winged helix-turn-helix transcriptional regulator [Streptomyces sp. SID11385]NEA44699.1 winged helix-turn-helix transcriptional regulator [Streptomyces sp. SID11385]